MTILAAGGQHITHGDHGGYLSDPYFPKAQLPSDALAMRLQQLADFAVAYEEGLTFAKDVTESWDSLVAHHGVPLESGQVIVQTNGMRLFIHILNASGRWDQELAVPDALTGLTLNLSNLSSSPISMWTASPALPIPQTFTGELLPSVVDWLMVCLEFKESIS
jgi:hypothetical protein